MAIHGRKALLNHSGQNPWSTSQGGGGALSREICKSRRFVSQEVIGWM
jgi:hypothetical protein